MLLALYIVDGVKIFEVTLLTDYISTLMQSSLIPVASMKSKEPLAIICQLTCVD